MFDSHRLHYFDRGIIERSIAICFAVKIAVGLAHSAPETFTTLVIAYRWRPSAVASKTHAQELR